MAEPNATSVSAQPDEVAERSGRSQTLQLSMRIETTNSANFVLGFLLNQLQRAGIQVDSIRVNRSEKPLAIYNRVREPRV